MLRVINCLSVEHDHGLVLLAAFICVLSGLLAMRIYAGLRQSTGGVRAAFLVLAALVAGSGIWTTHFIAMLAYQPGLDTAYEVTGTAASLGLAVVFSGLGLYVAASGMTGLRRIVGGAVFGAGIGVMHYAGMMAFRTQGYLAWETDLVIASVAIGMALAALAFWLVGDRPDRRSQIVAGLMLVLAICSLHFTGMGAVVIVPAPDMAVAPQMMSNTSMAVLIGAVALLILVAGAGVILMGDMTNSTALERMRRLANAAQEGLLVVRGGLVSDANAAALNLLGARMDDLIGRPADTLVRRDAEGQGELLPVDGAPPIAAEILERTLDRANAAQGDTVVLALRDLRERNAAEERIRYLAEHDSLTGLPNRHALKQRLDAALENADATHAKVAVLCIDLDHFKEANDVHGHLAGDALLVEVARRLRAELTAPSFAARLGGDEFVIVQVGGEQPGVSGDLAARVIESLRQPLRFEAHDLITGASVGIALFPEDGRAAQDLLTNADMALYRAKETGRGNFCFFSHEMDQSIRERRALARDLRHAITNEMLAVHYQPQATATDGVVRGFEALVRWTHPERGAISPGEFVPLAEEAGLIGDLGSWVLKTACAAAAAWDKPLKLAVNLSPLQLHQRDLVSLVHETLLETGLSPSRLELEITESALFRDYQRALDTLRRLKALGVSIAMDDFGTGFSSLSTLQSFPFDKIKIDKSFVENINRHERANVIVRAVLGLGRSLAIPVVAEGVETAEQIEFLKREACAELQGYAIGRPAPIEQLQNFTRNDAEDGLRAAG